MTKKKMTKKIKAVAKTVVKKTGLLAKQTKQQAGKAAKSLQKTWKKEAPRRERFKKELRAAGRQALKDGAKIGGDVFQTIRKDLKEISRRKQGK